MKKREELEVLEKLEEAQLVIPAQEEKLARQAKEIKVVPVTDNSTALGLSVLE